MHTLSPQDHTDLQRAVALLESPSLTAKITNVLGSPVELALQRLPAGVRAKVQTLTHTALHKAADAALWSLHNKPATAASTRLHKALAATSGAVGGALGFAALALELPVSTTIMLRSIADLARSEGFDLADIQTKQACLEVFALGGPTAADDAAESGYYAARAFLAETTSQLTKELGAMAAREAVGRVSVVPTQLSAWLAKLIDVVATRFGIVITEKLAAQAVPLIGGIAGATLNTLFIGYYQDMARGHFIVKRLERQYGEVLIRTHYLALQAHIR